MLNKCTIKINNIIIQTKWDITNNNMNYINNNSNQLIINKVFLSTMHLIISKVNHIYL